MFRKLLIALAALLVVLGGLLAWLVASFDAEKVKALAIDWMKQNHERTLVIDGPLELAVFPRVQVQLSNLRLSEQRSADDFVVADEAALSVAVLPLLSSALVVDRIFARGLSLSYNRNAKGVSNIDDLLGADTESAEASNSELSLDISKIEMQDVHVKVHDDLAEVRGEVTLEAFSSGRLADQTEAPLELAAQFKLSNPAVSGKLTGKTRLTLDMSGGPTRLSDMALKYQGSAMGINAIDVSMHGALAFNSADGSLQADNLLLEGNASAGELKLADSSLGIERFGFDPAHKNVTLAKLVLQVEGSTAGSPFMLALEWPQLEISDGTLHGRALTGELRLEGDTVVSGSFKSAAPSGDFEQITLPGFGAAFNGESGQRKLSGTLKSKLLLRPAKKSLALEDANLAAQLLEPGLNPMSLEVRGNATLSAEKTRWKLKGQLNSSDFNSTGSVALAGIAPTVNAQARFGTLDLNALLPAPKEAKAEAQDSGADTPIDLSALKGVSGRFDVRVSNFAYSAYRVKDAVLMATLNKGDLRVSKLAGKAWGGNIAASVFANANNNRLGIKGSVNGVNVKALLKDVADTDVLEGTGRVVLDIATSGRSVNEAKSGLKGTASLRLRDGTVKGINLAKKLRQAKAAMAVKKDSTVKSDQTEKTDFSEMSASFVINEGVARNSDLDAKSPFLRVGGNGAIDIGQSTIDYTVRANVVSSAQGQGGGELGALKGLTVPVHLSGPLEAMQWNIKWSGVATGVAKNKLKAKLQQKLGLPSADQAASSPSIKDALKEKLLKGLFK